MLIAQISDFHVAIGERLAGRFDTSANFAACIAHLKALRPAPDVILVTGDLTENGTDAEYAQVKEGLDSLGIAYRAVPGNHDLRAPMRQALGAATGTKDAHLGSVFQAGRLRLIGLDTLVEGAAHGALDEPQLAWLEAELARPSPGPSIIFMHHPPFATGIDSMDAIRLTHGRYGLERLLSSRSDVVALLCGHVHRPIAGRFAGVPSFIGPSASHAIALALEPDAPFAFCDEPPQIALHHWRRGELATHIQPIRR